MQELKFGDPHIARWLPCLNDRVETHLEYSIWYVSAAGRNRWASGMIHWTDCQPAELTQKILGLQTAFVQQRWTRLEVHIPNRDHYGHLRPDFIKDTGILLVMRQSH